MAFGRKNGRSFKSALSYLLKHKSLNKQSITVQHLNFDNDGVRGDDLKVSILSMGRYSKNAFTFKNDLKTLIGAKSDRELFKKILHFEFRDPLMLIGAFGAQLNRLESRYLLSGVTFKEAYIRKFDQFNTMLSMIHDISRFGLTDNLKHFIFQFSSEIIDPSFNLVAVDETTAQTIARDGNDENKNSDKNANDEPIIDSAFTFDGTEIMYNICSEYGCTIGVKTPIWSHYQSKRQHFGNIKKQTIFSKYTNDKITPRYCSNGSCWEYNFGMYGSPHAKICTIKTVEHLKTHYCAADEGPHPILLCPFVRCKACLSVLNIQNWFTTTYDYTLKYPAKPFKKDGSSGSGKSSQRGSKYNNNSNRNYDSSRSGGHGGSHSSRNYDDRDSHRDSNRDSYHYDNRNRGGRGHNGNRRQNGGRNDRDKRSNHNGNDNYR